MFPGLWFDARDRSVNGVGSMFVLVPHRAVAAWILDGRPAEYVRFDIQHVEFDVRGPS